MTRYLKQLAKHDKKSKTHHLILFQRDSDDTPPLTGSEQPTPPGILLVGHRTRVDPLPVLAILVGDALKLEVEDGLVLDDPFAGDERGLGIGVGQDQLRELERGGL
jgi:hypothetical protein